MPHPSQAEAPPLPVAAALVLAAALPSLLAFNLTPSPTIFNQCLAVGLWGGAALVLPTAMSFAAARNGRALFGALGALALGASWSWVHGGWPSALALSALLLLACAAWVLALGLAVARRADGETLVAMFLFGLVLAATLGALIAVVQVFLPEVADGDLIARSSLARRAVGNLRQPNHLSSQLAWGLIALIGVLELGRLRHATAWLLAPLLVGGVVLSGSRTGMVDMGVLALWALLDRRLSTASRRLLLAAPLFYLAGWLGMQAWAALSELPSATGRGGDISSSRFGIWSNTLSLIAQQPLAGVGFGEFNLAWSLTPFPGRPVAFFDHTHNLPLQFAVELGLPLAAGVLGLMGVALVQAWRRTADRAEAGSKVARPALLLVLAILLHSLLEYPLWYAYFLLPAAFAWGVALAGSREAGAIAATPAAIADAGRSAIPPDGWRAQPLRLGGALMLAGAVFTVWDYLHIVAIYAPPTDAVPLAERIARGQRSPLFAYQADYAALTTGEPADPQAQALALRRAPHFLLDTRLMTSLAQSLAARGELDRARYVADRLKEFRNPAAAPFFESCEAPLEGTSPLFQCQPSTARHDWRELAAP